MRVFAFEWVRLQFSFLLFMSFYLYVDLFLLRHKNSSSFFLSICLFLVSSFVPLLEANTWWVSFPLSVPLINNPSTHTVLVFFFFLLIFFSQSRTINISETNESPIICVNVYMCVSFSLNIHFLLELIVISDTHIERERESRWVERERDKWL
jgi:hypothetical protein